MLSSYLGDPNINKTQLLVGLFQMLTSVYLIGWFLSVYWAYKLIMLAGKPSTGPPATLNTANQNQNLQGVNKQYFP